MCRPVPGLSNAAAVLAVVFEKMWNGGMIRGALHVML